MHLSDDALRRMLRVDDTDLLTAESTDLQHLEQCPLCQNRLADLSGERQWFAGLSDEIIQVHRQTETQPWGTNAEQLTGEWEQGQAPRQEPVWSSGRITVSIHPREEHDLDGDVSVTDIRAISTDFLPPALHPELLGRLGRYDIEQLIGAGGFGIVFKAYDSELRRVVALKVLAPHLNSSGAARKRFAREAQAAAAIMHEHVIPIYDVVSQPEACYLVMQYIAGLSLQERVDRHGPMSIAEVLRVGAQIAAGLQAAHQQGLVHRDVKPANILLEESVERVMISDFGLARTADDANLTRSGAITGTPHYMSPEQASGGLVDTRSDLFSLGSVLYFACTGRPAFRAPQIVAVLNRICHYPHRRVSEVNQDVPGPIADLIDRLLEKDPEKRFGSALEVEQQLRQLLADWQSGTMAASFSSAGLIADREVAVNSAPLTPATVTSATVTPAILTTGNDAKSWARFSNHYWGSAALVVLAFSFFGAWYGSDQSGFWSAFQIFPTQPGQQSEATTQQSEATTFVGEENLVVALPNHSRDAVSGNADSAWMHNRNSTQGLQLIFREVWSSDSEPLEQEVDMLLHQWKWQEEELEIWLEYLKEIQASQAEK
jgi:serine/threonine protein kinase